MNFYRLKTASESSQAKTADDSSQSNQDTGVSYHFGMPQSARVIPKG